MVLYTNLQEAYKKKTWVFVDGDDSGKGVIERLKESYKKWDISKFQTFNQTDFEYYYPEIFSEEIKKILEIKDAKVKRDAKNGLLNDVRAWLDEDKTRGKNALKISAKEIINHLKTIEMCL